MKRLASVLILIFISSCATPGTQAWMDSYGIPSEVVANMEIKHPTPDIPQHLAKFSGVWCGNYKASNVANCLSVMEISPDEAIVMRIWGDDPKHKFNAGFEKYKAKFKDDGKLYFKVKRASGEERENTYQFRSDYKELILVQTWQTLDGKDKQDWAVLKKVPHAMIAKRC